MSTIKDQLTAAVNARKDSLKELRQRIADLVEAVPIGVQLKDDSGMVAKMVRVCTGASQWGNQTWNVTIKGKALLTADGKLIAERLDDSYFDGNNMHYRKTEPTCLGSVGWDDRTGKPLALDWAGGKDTRALALRLPEAITRYIAECAAEREANSSTLAK